jgi:CubicO group peptidase (beta-lactamase class C family)
MIFALLLTLSASHPAAVAQPAGQAASLERRLQASFNQSGFSGAVLVANRDRIIFQGGFGLASREYQRPNRIDTQFNLASLNKSMTAVAVMRLVEQSRLGLDDRVDRHLGGRWLALPVASRITVRQLLAHTSGLGDYLASAGALGCATPLRSLRDYRPLMAAAELEFEPGTRSSYSNMGYLVLGAIIESVTGEEYDSHLRRTLYQPLGMSRTEAVDLSLGHTNLAHGYYREPLAPLPRDRRLSDSEVEAHFERVGFRWRNNSYRCARPGTPAGGYYSTVADLYRFARALQAGRLVSTATLAEMRRSHSTDNPNYGLGFTTRDGHIGHSGSAPGAESRYRILPDGHIIIVLGNSEGSVNRAFRIIEAVGSGAGEGSSPS